MHEDGTFHVVQIHCRFVKMLGDAMRDAKNHSQTNGAKRALGEATTYEEYAVILETTESQ